jgi:hypothetical protein
MALVRSEETGDDHGAQTDDDDAAAAAAVPAAAVDAHEEGTCRRLHS